MHLVIKRQLYGHIVFLRGLNVSKLVVGEGRLVVVGLPSQACSHDEGIFSVFFLLFFSSRILRFLDLTSI